MSAPLGKKGTAPAAKGVRRDSPHFPRGRTGCLRPLRRVNSGRKPPSCGSRRAEGPPREVDLGAAGGIVAGLRKRGGQ